MKHKIELFVSLVIIITSCKSSFVGTVTFKTTIKANSSIYSNISNDYKERYGDSMEVVYYPNGDMKRFHKNSSFEKGLNYQLYRADKGEVYFVYFNGNIKTVNVSSYSIKKIRKYKTPNEEIAGVLCKCYTIEALAKNDSGKIELNICYPKRTSDYRLNPRLYRNYKDYFLYKFYRKAKVPYFKYYMNFNTISIHYDGIKINKMKIENDTIFERFESPEKDFIKK